MGINKIFVNVFMENFIMEDINRFLQFLNLIKMLEIDMDKYFQELVIIILIIFCIMVLCINVLFIFVIIYVLSNLFIVYFRLIFSLVVSDIFIVFSVVVYIMNKVLNFFFLFYMYIKDERFLFVCGFQFVVFLNVIVYLIFFFNFFVMV